MKLFVYLRAIIGTVVESIFFRKKQINSTRKRKVDQKSIKPLRRQEEIILPPRPSEIDIAINELNVKGLVPPIISSKDIMENFHSKILSVPPDETIDSSKDDPTELVPSIKFQFDEIGPSEAEINLPIMTNEERPEDYERKLPEVYPLFSPDQNVNIDKSDATNIFFVTDETTDELTIIEPTDELVSFADTYPEELEKELTQLNLFNIEPDQIDGNSTNYHEEFTPPQENAQVDTISRVPRQITPISSFQRDYRNKASSQHQKCPFLRKPSMINLGCTNDEIEIFLKDLENDDLENIFLLPVERLEKFFINTMRKFQYVGDLPISRRAYEGLIDYQRRITLKNGKIRPQYSSPSIFTICMVFCARYAETEVREFWRPYAQQVWNCEPSQNFMNLCRKLFVYSRNYLAEYSGLAFNFTRTGEVVRPVYQHAIIPSYLQEHFVDWLVDHFESLLQYSHDQLPQLLRYDRSLDYVPPRLREFFRGEDTITTATQLIARMSSAIKLYHDLGQTEAVESVINSTIEKSLWEVIYKRLIDDQANLIKLRNITPKLDWRWDLNKDEVYLYLSNIRSDKTGKPDSVIWAQRQAGFFKSSPFFKKITPWQLKSGSWELDPVAITEQGPMDGSILVLSEDYDLDKPKEVQKQSIIFERDVPSIQKNIQYFKVDNINQIGIRKEKIDSDGVWVIATSKKISLTDNSGNVVIPEPLGVPSWLRSFGVVQANKFSIQLPVVIQHDDNMQRFERAQEDQNLNPVLWGKEKVSAMSPFVPRVFRSPDIVFQFSINPKANDLQRTWLLIRRNGEFLASIQLADVLKGNRMILEKDLMAIDLSSYLILPGAYTINLLFDLNPLLDQPIQFAWLPESVIISEPDLNVCYSRTNPLQVTIEGVNEKHLRLFQEEKFKKIVQDHTIRIEWKVLKDSKCRFDILWEGYPIQFCWDVDRVAAWVDDGGEKSWILEGNEPGAILQVRGRPNEIFSWEVNGLERRNRLDAIRGEYQAKLLETELRDMLLESDMAESTVNISIRDYTWEVLSYLKQPVVEIITVDYQKNKLHILMKQERKLRGEYSIQIHNLLNFNRQKVYSTTGFLDDEYSLKMNLDPGEYRVEIVLFGKICSRSSIFTVIEDPTTIQQVGMDIQSTPNYDSPENLFKILTAPKEKLIRRSHPRLAIGPSVEQLKSIHDPDEWVTDDPWNPRYSAPQKKLANYPWNESFKNLLPTWAVLRYPLRFTTKEHQIVLRVFPEKVAYGARAGRGYVDLKIEGEKLRASASWKPTGNEGYSTLWIGISQQSNVQLFCDLKQDFLWPGYQCKSCGTIVASRSGDYLKLPPSVVRLHQHGEDKLINDLFLDTVYVSTDPMLVTIEQYEEEPLHHAFPIEDVVIPDYLSSLIEGNKIPGENDLEMCLPIELFQHDDYKIAIDDLFRNLNSSAIQEFQMCSGEIDKFNQFLVDKSDLIPAFSAMQRLMHAIHAPTSPLDIPGKILTLAMILRMKANKPGSYAEFSSGFKNFEEILVKLLYYSAQGCPKLLEWCIAWAELFYVHAIS